MNNIQEITRIPIKHYLARLGIYPAKDRNYYGMYLCPYKTDLNPSMKVDYNKNLWIDYGTGIGGSIIDLVMRIDKCTTKDAIQKLKQCLSLPNEIFSFHCKPTVTPIITESTMKLLEVKNIKYSALREYLKSRCINEDIYSRYCKEINYQVRDKRYFTIGFINESGGYELRNRAFKGCIGKKDMSYIKRKSTTLMVFEGFMDYLSFLTYAKLKGSDMISNAAIILNSIVNVKKLYPFLNNYTRIELFLDADDAGEKCTQSIKQYQSKETEIIDRKGNYFGYKDVNEFLIHTITNQ